MDREPAAGDGPRPWARPDIEGDLWHEYWEPDGAAEQRARLNLEARNPHAPVEREARVRLGRRIAIGYLIASPIAMLLNQVLWRLPSAPVTAAVGAVATLITLIRVRTYGVRSPAVTSAMVALLLAWVAVVVAHAV